MIIRIKKRILTLLLFMFLVSIAVVYAPSTTIVRNFKVDLVISNQLPKINVSNVTGFPVDPIAGGNTVVFISFNVTDADGAGNINASKTIINFTLGGGGGQFFTNISAVSTSEFGTCNNVSTGSTSMIINCTVALPYFTNASSDWVINITVQDINGGTARNDTLRFTVNTVSGLALPITFVNFTNVNLGTQDVPSSPLIINNTGNDDFDQINITAAALVGQTITSESIAVTNFYANITNATAGLGVQLATTPVTLRELIQGTGLDNATLVHGHTSAYTPIADKGNRTIHFWVDVPSSGLSAQLYNATWNVTAVNLP